MKALIFKYALRGIRAVFRTEINARIHLIIASCVTLAGLIFGITRYEWIAICICIGMVIGAEIFNTAIERLVDLVSPEFNEKAGMIKDISAGAVLFVALASMVTGLIIFIPQIIDALKSGVQ